MPISHLLRNDKLGNELINLNFFGLIAVNESDFSLDVEDYLIGEFSLVSYISYPKFQ